MDTAIREQEAIPARIDRLPMSREIWGIMLLAGVAWLVESYDVGMIGSLLPSLVKEFHLGAFSEGLLAIASTLGIVISVIPAGWLADNIGRKKFSSVSRLEHDIERRTGEQLPPPQIVDLEAKSDTGGAIHRAQYPSTEAVDEFGISQQVIDVRSLLAPINGPTRLHHQDGVLDNDLNSRQACQSQTGSHPLADLLGFDEAALGRLPSA